MKILTRLNYAFIVFPLMLFSLGYLTLLASSVERAQAQLTFLLIGVVFYCITAWIDYSVFRYFWKYILGVAYFLLIVLFVIGSMQLGAVRWISLGIFNIQPSEIAKFALILALASYISLNPDYKTNFKKQIISLLFCAPLTLLVFIQPDLGTTIVLVGILLFMAFFSGISKWYFVIAFLVIGALSNPIWNSLKEYQKIRVMVFLNPQLDVQGHGYNVIQSVISIGSGGLFGKGFGRGSQTQMNFLPVHWTDFIFASFSEEWGFIGVILLIFLFTAMLVCLLIMINKLKDPYAILLCVGVFAVLFVQFAINVGMNLGLMPVTGITLPMVSYGGSSLIVSMVLFGLLQSIWLRNRS